MGRRQEERGGGGPFLEYFAIKPDPFGDAE